MNNNAMLKPALWGGVVIGVLSGLPLVSAGNCCCCLWIVAGGALAAFLLQNATPTPIAMGDGALVGLLSGLIGAVVNTIIAVPMTILLGPVQQKLLQRIMEAQPDMPENVRQMFDNMGGAGVTAIGVVMTFVTMLVLGAVFASLGGLLGAFFFKKKDLPPVPVA